MAILVVGSVAFDSVKTPFGERDRILGGSATYFSVAASFFTDVRVVAVVGDDFGPADEAVFLEREIDTSDLERVPGRSFHWSGEYGYDLNVAHTRDTQLNVFADFKPKLSDRARETPYLFLGNIQPQLQVEVREQVAAKLVAADTMNYWINNTLRRERLPGKPTLFELRAAYSPWVRKGWSSSEENMARRCSPRTLTLQRRLILLKRFLILRARATALPEVLWDTWRLPTRSMKPRSGEVSSTARLWPRSTLKSSDASACVT